jgi:succinate dehydrogenase / fumarate reductase cytochrome b subunit
LVRITVNDNRPVNLDMTTIQLPLPALVSILTRASGVFIFLGMAVMLWLLDLSLSSAAGFAEAQQLLDTVLAKLLVWSIVSGVIYHALAGIKHLVADIGIGETLEGGILGARLVILGSAVLIALAGIWIW